MADYDSDGDLDLFSASPEGNALLVNEGGTYKIVEPQQIGLSDRALTANWVDYDNDGLTDLHAVPGGLYRQQSDRETAAYADRTFAATNLLESTSQELIEARASWFDADNNGSRDLLLSTRYNDSLWEKISKKLTPLSVHSSFSKLTLYPNIGNTNHWLEIKLIGPPGNRPAIGTNVEVVTSDGIQFQAVGQADGSQYSQGHYRLYFGLGKNKSVDLLRVLWSDGSVREFENVASDQLLAIERME